VRRASSCDTARATRGGTHQHSAEEWKNKENGACADYKGRIARDDRALWGNFLRGLVLPQQAMYACIRLLLQEEQEIETFQIHLPISQVNKPCFTTAAQKLGNRNSPTWFLASK
jgi:hypothetical protein